MNGAYYPIIDLFAGPGGLGEGFASLIRRGKPSFKSVAAIERDKHANATLMLRHFMRAFPKGEVPDEYYYYLAGRITKEELIKKFPMEWQYAENSTLCISLGDSDPSALNRIVCERLKKHKKWVLVGGPPCQAYSLVGRSRRANDPDFENDEKHFLYREYLKIIIDHAPPVFVMENVKGLLSAKINGIPVINKILNDLAKPKAAISSVENGLSYKLYSLTEPGAFEGEASSRSFIVKAEDYGVPQARHRIFIVGVRSDIKVEPETLQKQKSPTVRQVIGSMPAIRSGISRESDNHEAWVNAIKEVKDQPWFEQKFKETHNRVFGSSIVSKHLQMLPRERRSSVYNKPKFMTKWFFDTRLNSITGHEARSHMRTDLHRYFFSALYAEAAGVSPKLANFPEELLPNHKNVLAGKQGKMFSDRFRVQLPEKVSTTVTSHISKDGHYFIHFDPNQCRSLTVREAARLQTFPDNYHFEGPRTEQYHQVGNAVPPYLAHQISEIVADLLDRIAEH